MRMMPNTSAIVNDGMNCLLEKPGVIETEMVISHLLREPFDYAAWQ
jgi:pyrroline-5-carboxylate reductase